MKTTRPFFLLLLLCALCASVASGADRITASIIITNGPTTNGMTFAITTTGSTTRTWTNSVQNSASQILTNATASGSATNLYLHLSATPPAGAVVSLTGATNITIAAGTGVPLSISGSGNYFSVTYATQAVTATFDVRIPMSVESTAQKTNISSGLVDWLNYSGNTNQLGQTNPALAQLLGTTNTQTISGSKTFSSTSGIWNGNVTNSPYVSSTNFLLIGGKFYAYDNVGAGVSNIFQYNGNSLEFMPGGVVLNSTTVNGAIDVSGNINAGTNIVMNNGGSFSFAFDGSGGLSMYAASVPSTNIIGTLQATQDVRTASLTVSNSAAIARATFSNTNTFPAGSDVSFGRFAVTSLANGNNAAVPVGTNLFVEVSGPSTAFTINGINAANAQRDGKLLVILNRTGQNMTIAHQSGTDPTAANRIITMTGADRATTGDGAATFLYDSSTSRWILIAFDP